MTPLLDPLRAHSESTKGGFASVLRRTRRLLNGEYVELALTSQEWRGEVWRHRLYILKPSTATAQAAGLLYISGGSCDDEARGEEEDRRFIGELSLFAQLAEETGSIVGVLTHVPNQPLFDGKTENELLAYTFERFLSTGDTDWPILVPMVTSVMRSLDAMRIAASERWSVAIDAFTLAGMSKRGWAAWLTAAADPRVRAVCPIMMDFLDIRTQIEHQRRVWGHLSPKLSGFERADISSRLESDRGESLLDLIDPVRRSDFGGVHKAIISATNDEYWPVDACNLYRGTLKGECYLSYIPNGRHGSLDFQRILGLIGALHRTAHGGPPIPRLEATLEQRQGSVLLDMTSDQEPGSIGAWVARSPSRDLRDARWSLVPARPESGAYVVRTATRTDETLALFGEAAYSTGGPEFKLSTRVWVLADAPPAATDGMPTKVGPDFRDGSFGATSAGR